MNNEAAQVCQEIPCTLMACIYETQGRLDSAREVCEHLREKFGLSDSLGNYVANEKLEKASFLATAQRMLNDSTRLLTCIQEIRDIIGA